MAEWKIERTKNRRMNNEYMRRKQEVASYQCFYRDLLHGPWTRVFRRPLEIQNKKGKKHVILDKKSGAALKSKLKMSLKMKMTYILFSCL